MRDAGFADFERGERGSTAQHLSVTEFKVKKDVRSMSTAMWERHLSLMT